MLKNALEIMQSFIDQATGLGVFKKASAVITTQHAFEIINKELAQLQEENELLKKQIAEKNGSD